MRAQPEPAKDLPKMMSIKQVAEYVQMSTHWIRAQIKDGNLPAIRMGSKWRITRGDLQDFLRRLPSGSGRIG